jgi:hypothetical protein
MKPTAALGTLIITIFIRRQDLKVIIIDEYAYEWHTSAIAINQLEQVIVLLCRRKPIRRNTIQIVVILKARVVPRRIPPLLSPVPNGALAFTDAI